MRSSSLEHSELLRFIMAEGKTTVTRRYTIALKRAELLITKMNSNAPKVGIILDQLRTVIAGYKSILAAIDGINPDQFALGGSFLFEQSAAGPEREASDWPDKELLPVSTLPRMQPEGQDPAPIPKALKKEQPQPVKNPRGYATCRRCGQVVSCRGLLNHQANRCKTGVRSMATTAKGGDEKNAG